MRQPQKTEQADHQWRIGLEEQRQTGARSMVSGENNMISSTQFQSGVLDRNNLNRAYFRVVRNKEAAGIDGMTVDESPAELLERLTKGTYKPNDDLLKLKVKVIVYVLQK